MTRPLGALAALVFLAGPALAADPYTIKVAEKTEPPKELNEAVRKELGDTAVQFLDDKGKVLAEVWFRKEVPATATDAQIANGLTWMEIEQTTLIGAVRLADDGGDYKKQKIKSGVYTLRLGVQPMDGDHMGTAPNNEFLILVPAKNDMGEAKMEPEKLIKMSLRASNTGHPAVWLLFPVAKKDLNKAPSLAKRESNHWVLTVTQKVKVGDKKEAAIGIALTLIGVSSAV